MLTLLLILAPIAFSLYLLLARPANSKVPALVFAVAELALMLFACTQFHINADPQFVLNEEWIHSLGIRFHVGMDGISLLMVLLTSLLLPLIILSSFSKERSATFYGLMFLMQGGLVGVFTALDGFLFYVFWEVALIPIYFICLFWGGRDRVKITFRFFIYTLAGSLLMLACLIYLYLQTPGRHSFDINALYQVSLSSSTQALIFWGFFIAFAIKMPVFPFHSWQPDTYTDAPAQGTMLLSGIMLKMGTYGLLRWLLPIAPHGVQDWAPLALILSVCGILYGSLMAWAQTDFKRLIAWSSVAHVGLIAAGILSRNINGFSGSIMQMMSHGVYVMALFFICEILENRSGKRELSSFGGLRSQAPVFATLFLIILLASIGLPLTAGFAGEFLLLSGVFQYSAWLAALAGLSIIFGAVYMLGAYQKLMLGEPLHSGSAFADVSGSEKAVLILSAVLLIAGGVYPKPVFDIAEPALQHLLDICNK